MLTSKPQSFYIINLLSHQTNVTRIVLVFFPHLSSPLPLPTHCAAVPPQRPLIRKCDLALCTFDATSPLPPPLPPICTPVMSAPFICETEQRKDPSTDKDFGSPLCHRLVLSTSSLLLSSSFSTFSSSTGIPRPPHPPDISPYYPLSPGTVGQIPHPLGWLVPQ